MTFTVSHRQAGVTRADVAGLIRHEYRDVDKSNGIETQHSNERIVPARTHLNESVLYIDGDEVELTKSSQILDELDRRLSSAGGTRVDLKTGKTTKIATRKDAKVVRNIVLQLDPNFTRSSEYLLSANCSKNHYDNVKSYLAEMVEHYAGLYGRENLLASTFHIDETSPHVHLMVTPIDSEGRIRQDSFIKAGKGPKSAMAQNDKAMRKRLAAVGYDVSLEPTGINRTHMSVDEYAHFAATLQYIAERDIELEDREELIRRQNAALSAQASKQAAAEEETQRKLRRVNARLEDALILEERADQKRSKALELHTEAVKMRNEAQLAIARAQAQKAQFDELQDAFTEALKEISKTSKMYKEVSDNLKSRGVKLTQTQLDDRQRLIAQAERARAIKAKAEKLRKDFYSGPEV